MSQAFSFDSNEAFLSASMDFVDRCIGSAMEARAGGLRTPRGLVVTSDRAAEALRGRPVRDPRLAEDYERWQAAVAGAACPLPLTDLCALLGLTPFAVFCALLALSVAYDRKYELLYGYLNDNISRGLPNLGCARALYSLFANVEEAEIAAFFSDDLSGNACLFEMPAEGGLAAPLVLCEKARLAALGADAVAAEISPFVQRLEPAAASLDYGLARVRLSELLLTLLDGERNCVVRLVGAPGIGRKRVLRRFAAETGLGVLRVDCARLLASEREMRRMGRVIAAEALLGGALVLLDGFDTSGEGYEARRQALLDELGRRLKVTLLSQEQPGQPSLQLLDVQMDFPLPSPEDARRLWADALAGYDREDFAPRLLADKYALSPGRVQETLREAWLDCQLAGEDRLTLKRVVSVIRRRATHHMDGQATRINAFYTWEDLVVAEETARELHLFCNRVKYRGVVMDDWNFSSRLAYGKAVSALFYGVPGTGKTMAAQVVAGDLDLDLYRVDLSQIMNKYVGETEKSLSRIFDEAAHCGGILFFDEADALFAKRTEIADSKDKYANAETAFLLQKIEEFDGLVILATNLAENFDDAFKRRINYMIHFTMPDRGQRRELWRKVFPPPVEAERRLDLDFLAESFELTGSTIKAIAVSAAYMAAADGERIDMRHIIRALKHEYAKSGGILIKSKLREYDVE